VRHRAGDATVNPAPAKNTRWGAASRAVAVEEDEVNWEIKKRQKQTEPLCQRLVRTTVEILGSKKGSVAKLMSQHVTFQTINSRLSRCNKIWDGGFTFLKMWD
jgi:hypothetical protein